MITYAAIGLYLLTAALCCIAAYCARKTLSPQHRSLRWGIVSAAFIALAAIRFFAVEEIVRRSLRQALRQSQLYADRAEVQGPLLVAAAIALFIMGMAAWHHISRTHGPQRYLAVAEMAALAFAPLFALRLLSLHSVDQLLYYGPVKGNWLIDAGLTLLVAGCALLALRTPDPRRKPGTRGSRTHKPHRPRFRDQP
ncbi:hypothetical protein [Aurantiacibacter odishensis]|uniref:hypothetical protein n=1 Tax=Aurantiacibacter odishensis TaxID=1155476 RepID=UPI000E73DAFD|nr:hypothetical protein [Aurantiacibacter odishensis]